MTAHNVILLTCDHDGCGNTWTGKKCEDVGLTRLKAYECGGWSTSMRNGVMHDWCWFHA